MIQRVYVIESPRSPAFPLTMIESIVVGVLVGGHFVHRHQDVSLVAIAIGVFAFLGYLMLHGQQATAWIVLIAGALIWGGIGYGIAHGAWPGHGAAQIICAAVGVFLSLAEKKRIMNNTGETT